MGKSSRARRAEKRRRHRKEAGRQRTTRADAHRARIDLVLHRACEAFRRGRTALVDEEVERLGHHPADVPARQWAGLIDQVIASRLEEAVSRAWQRGWQPADLPFVVAKNPLGRGKLGPHHQTLTIDAIAAEGQAYAPATLDPRWRHQLAALNARIWWDVGMPHLSQWARREQLDRRASVRVAVEMLSVLATLPSVERLCPPPGTARAPTSGTPSAEAAATQAGDGGLGAKMLVRVRALLAKAESTTFAEEAETLTAKAQELMARYAIDQAMVDAAGTAHGRAAGADGPGGAVGWRIHHEDPYASGKSTLLAAVARANRCRTVYSPGLGFSTVFGFPVDLRNTEVLFTSLLVQAAAAMAAAGPQTDQFGRSRTRSFRSSFYAGYAHRVGQRLKEASATTVAEAGRHHGSALVPVLVARGQAVDSAMNETFPHLTRRRSSVSNGAGWYAGQAAGELADLGTRAEVATQAS